MNRMVSAVVLGCALLELAGGVSPVSAKARYSRTFVTQMGDALAVRVHDKVVFNGLTAASMPG